MQFSPSLELQLKITTTLILSKIPTLQKELMYFVIQKGVKLLSHWHSGVTPVHGSTLLLVCFLYNLMMTVLLE